MKNTLLLIFVIIFSLKIKAQTVEASTTIPTNEYLDLLATNLMIPEAVQRKFANQDLNLTIVLTITKDGSVFNPKIQNDSLQLESNLKKAIEKLPKWNPRTEDHIAVVSRKAFNLVIPVESPEINIKTLERAKPKEGIQKYYQNVVRNINVEKYLNDKESISEIKMIATFIVEKDGSFTDIKIRESNEPSFNNEAIRVLKSMPKWNPATENGIPIRSDFTLPIMIKFNK